MGTTPASAAKDAFDASLSGLSPAVLNSVAAVTGPTPLTETRGGFTRRIHVSS